MSYASHSHPESAERDPTANREPRTVNASPKIIDPALLADLEAYRKAKGLTNKQLGSRIQFSESQVGRALAQLKGAAKFNGSVENFEARARDLLAREEAARQMPVAALRKSGFVVAPMADFLDTVSTAQQIGVAYSAAGRGKTMGARVWLADHPLAVFVTACKSVAGWRQLRAAIVEALPYSSRPKGREDLAAFIQRTFVNSGRLLIIDNAHLLTESARYWLAYDWHGKTACPVALIGNEMIVRQWGHREGAEDANDQLSSRVGIAQEIRPAAEATARASALLTLEELFPQACGDEEAINLAAQVIRQKGHGRSLENHVKIARGLAEAKGYAPAVAIRRANSMLLGQKLAA